MSSARPVDLNMSREVDKLSDQNVYSFLFFFLRPLPLSAYLYPLVCLFVNLLAYLLIIFRFVFIDFWFWFLCVEGE